MCKKIHSTWSTQFIFMHVVGFMLMITLIYTLNQMRGAIVRASALFIKWIAGGSNLTVSKHFAFWNSRMLSISRGSTKPNAINKDYHLANALFLTMYDINLFVHFNFKKQSDSPYRSTS